MAFGKGAREMDCSDWLDPRLVPTLGLESRVTPVCTAKTRVREEVVPLRNSESVNRHGKGR